jgi:hypothetical protein
VPSAFTSRSPPIPQPRSLSSKSASAKPAKRLNLFDTLIHLLQEQAPILDSSFQAKVEYYRGLLLYDQRAYGEALEVLRKLRFDSFDAAFAATARFRVGLALERCGSWKQAERYTGR